MKNLLLNISQMFGALPNKLINNRWWVLSALVIITIVCIAGMGKISIDVTTDSFLDENDPSMLAMDEFREQFGSDDSLYVVYKAKDGDVFSKQSLEAVSQLTDELENWQSLDAVDYQPEDNIKIESFADLRHIRRVQSISNISVQENVGDTLRSDKLVPSTLPADFSALKQKALAQDDFIKAYYSEDLKYGALIISTDFGAEPVESEVVVEELDFDADALFDDSDSFESSIFDDSAEVQKVEFKPTDMNDYTGFYNELKLIMLQDQYTEAFEFYPVGNASMMDFVADSLVQAGFLMLGMVVIVIGLLWSLFRSASAVVWPVLTIVISVIWVFGLFSWLGIPMSTMVSLTAILIFAVGIADCVHVLSSYITLRKDGDSHEKAISHAYEQTGLALLVTSITTMAGLIAVSFSGIPPVQVFAWMAASGVLIAFLLTIFMLPLLLTLWHPGKPEAFAKPSVFERFVSASMIIKLIVVLIIGAGLYGVIDAGNLPWTVAPFVIGLLVITGLVKIYQRNTLEKIPDFVAKRPLTIAGLFFSLFVVLAYGASMIKIDTNIAEMTKEGSKLRTAYQVVDENMGGAQNIEIMLNFDKSDALVEPEVLQKIENTQRWVEQNFPEHVVRTMSLVNIVKDTNKTMNDGNESFDVLPQSSLEVSQLLYLFNSSNPEDRRNLVSDDYSRSHISVSLRNGGSYEYSQFFTDINAYVDQEFASLNDQYPTMKIEVTGAIAMMMRMADQVAQTQFDSFAIALIAISVLLILTLGSYQAGLISIIPNIIPALLAFGLMGLLDIPLDTDTLMIAPVIIGIAVDDTVHFMTHYRVAFAKTGDMTAALRSATHEVGQAVLFTSMVLGFGFAILGFNDYAGMAKMGIFGSMAIFIALLSDLFLLPALILIFKPKMGNKEANMTFQPLSSDQAKGA